MFSGGTHCLRRRATSSAASGFDISKNEPLLFLYPRFFTSAVENSPSTTPFPLRRKRRARPTEGHSFRPVGHGCRNYAAQPVPDPANTSKTNSYLKSHRPHADDNLELPRTHGLLRLDSSSPIPLQNVDEADGHNQPPLEDNDQGARSAVPAFIDHEPRQHTHHDVKDGGWADNSNPEKSQLPANKLIRRVEGTVGFRKIDANKAWDWQRRMQTSGYYPVTAEKYALCMDTMENMVDLSRSISSPALPEYQETLELPEEKVVNLVGDERENMWDLRLGSGCRVHVPSRGSQDYGPTRKMILLGSRHAVKLAVAHITAETTTNHLPPFAHPHPELSQIAKQVPLIRSVWTSPEPMVSNVRADEIPQPETWTVKNFGDYVEDLTSISIPRSSHRVIYTSKDVHRIVVRDILFNLFSDPGNRIYFSTRAMNMLISYFSHHRFFSHLEALFPALSNLMTTRTCNAFFRVAAESRNLEVMNLYISMMKHLKVKPNGWEWVSFIAAIQPNILRIPVLMELKRSDIVHDPFILRTAVTVAIQSSFRAHMDTGGSLLSFIESIDDTMGVDWVSTDSINKMLLEAALMKKFDMITEIIDYCKVKQLKLNATSLNNVLLYFVETKRVMAALEFYADFMRSFYVERDSRTIRLWWHLAWKKRAYNLCRVVWRYACIEGNVTWEMQNAVHSGLVRNLNPEIIPGTQIWRQNVGKVVAGVSPDPEETMPFSDLYVYKVKGPERTHQIELAKRVLGRDLRASEYSYRHKPFESMIVKAYDLDQEWGGSVQRRPVQWLRENAIDVPMKIQQKNTAPDDNLDITPGT